MLTRIFVAIFALFSVILAAGLPGQGASVDLSISGTETGCKGASFCFKVTAGSLDNLSPGDEATIRFTNDGNAIHNLHVTTSDKADASHKATPLGARIAGTADQVAPGESESFTFTVPSGATGIYIWCSIEGHEQYGMWLQTGSGGSGSQSKGLPMGLPVILLAFGLVALARRRQT